MTPYSCVYLIRQTNQREEKTNETERDREIQGDKRNLKIIQRALVGKQFDMLKMKMKKEEQWLDFLQDSRRQRQFYRYEYPHEYHTLRWSLQRSEEQKKRKRVMVVEKYLHLTYTIQKKIMNSHREQSFYHTLPQTFECTSEQQQGANPSKKQPPIPHKD